MDTHPSPHLAALVAEAETLTRHGRPQEARGLWEKVVALDPTHSTALNQLGTQALGRGDLGFVAGENTKILALLRRHGEHRLLAVINLSRHAQATVCVACGIHLERIQPSEIADVLALADQLTDDLIRWMA